MDIVDIFVIYCLVIVGAYTFNALCRNSYLLDGSWKILSPVEVEEKNMYELMHVDNENNNTAIELVLHHSVLVLR